MKVIKISAVWCGACIIMNTTKELGGTVDGYEIMEVI